MNLLVSAVAALAAPVWTELPSLPDPMGFGGPFVGQTKGALLVLGGANFPNGMPWEGGKKVWHRSAFVLDGPDAKNWSKLPDLPWTRAYGSTVEVDDGLILIGGQDADRPTAEVLKLTLSADRRTYTLDRLPDLPAPSAYGAACRVGRSLFAACGQTTNDSIHTARRFWRLDLDATGEGWAELRAWPGPARVKAAMGPIKTKEGDALLLTSGEVTVKMLDGTVRYRYLNDAYVFVPSKGGDGIWRAVSGPPRPVAASESVPYKGGLAVFSGATGEGVDLPVQDRPKFPKDVLWYDPISDRWAHMLDMPEGVVTTGATYFGTGIAVPTGEVKAGIRTPVCRLLVLDPPRR